MITSIFDVSYYAHYISEVSFKGWRPLSITQLLHRSPRNKSVVFWYFPQPAAPHHCIWVEYILQQLCLVLVYYSQKPLAYVTAQQIHRTKAMKTLSKSINSIHFLYSKPTDGWKSATKTHQQTMICHLQLLARNKSLNLITDKSET